MPLGENVGRAYVTIYADGSSIPDDIRDSLEDADPVVRSAAEEHGETYDKHFAKGVDKEGKIAKGLQSQLEKGLADADLTDRFFGGSQWTEFRDKVEGEFGQAGRDAADELADEFTRRGSLRGIEAEMRTMTNRVADYIKRAGKEELKFAEDAFRQVHEQQDRMWRETDEDFERHLKDLARSAQDHADEEARIHRDQEFEWDRHVHSLSQNVGRIEKQYEEIEAALRSLEAGQKSTRGGRAELINQLRDLERLMHSAGGATDDWILSLKNAEKRLIHLHPHLTRVSKGVDELGDRFGAAFGRGSRNDFLNIIGGVARGLIRLVGVIPKAIALFSDFGRTVKFAFDESMKNGSSVFRASMAGIIAGLESFGTAVAGIALVLAGAVFIVGPLIGILSSLAGIVTALAASITFGLIGAVSVLAGALLPLVAGLGFAVAGFLALDEAQKKVLKNDFKPVVSEFKELGDLIAKGMFGNAEEQADRFQGVLKGFEPLARRMGEAISGIGDDFLDVLESPGFVAFQDALAKRLPNQTEVLGRAINNTFGGLAGVFRALMPQVSRFLTWLEDVTGQFDEWANSVKGQKELRQFFQDASDSAVILGDVLGGVRDILVELFDQGRPAGNNMLSSLADGLDGIATWLDENPDSLAQWFSDAEDLFGTLGDLVRDVADAFDALDTSTSRLEGNKAIQLLAVFTEAGAGTLSMYSEGIYLLAGAFKELGSALGWVISGQMFQDAWDDLASLDWSGIWKGLKDSARDAIHGLGDIFRNIKLPTGNLGGRLQIINPGDVARQIGNAVRIIGTLPARAAAAAAGVAGRIASHFSGLPGQVMSFVNSVISRVRSAFASLPRQIGNALSGLTEVIVAPFNAAVDGLSGIVGQIVEPFRGLASSILGAIGTIDISSLISLPSRSSILGMLASTIPGYNIIKGNAEGAYYGRTGSSPMLRWVMEDGPEAIVPLDRPLGQVDPSVRGLSAIAQGKAGVVGGGGKRIDVGGITVLSNSEDPEAVAVETLNRLVSLTY